MRASRRRGLSPFRRRVFVALLAVLPGALLARAAVALVPGPAEASALGDVLFGVAVEAVVAALLWPFADGLVPPATPPDEDD